MSKERLIKIIVSSVLSISVIVLIIGIFVHHFGMKGIFNIVQDLNGAEISSASVISSYEKNVVMINSDGLYFINDSGQTEKFYQTVYSNPTLNRENGHLIAFDIGGTDFSVYDGLKRLYEMSSENKIITACINRNGTFAVATEVSGYNAQVFVYDYGGNLLYKYLLGDGSLLDMTISPDDTHIAFSVFSQNQGIATGKIVFVSVKETKPLGVFESEAIYLKIKYTRDGSLIALSPSGIDFIGSKMQKKWSYSFNHNALLGAYIDDPDMISVALSHTGEGLGKSEIVMLNRLGEKIGNIVLDGTVKSLCATDDLIVASYSDKVAFINQKGKIKRLSGCKSDIKAIAPFSDSQSALVLCGQTLKVVKTEVYSNKH